MAKKSAIKDIWDFLWKSDSVWSWLVDLILAFLIVKFIFFPLMSLILSSSLPFVVVESNSMLHESNFDAFWEKQGAFYKDFNITKEAFEEFSFKNGFKKGDIMVISGKEDYEIGDIIVFRVPVQQKPIIHRIISKNSALNTFETKGDYNAYQLSYEKSVSKEQVIGKAVGKVPMLGWVKLVFAGIFGLS